MATITLTFPNPLNSSLQIGDTAYYMNTADHVITDGEYTLDNASSNPSFSENLSGNPTQAYANIFIEMGMVTDLPVNMGGSLSTANQMQVYMNATQTRPTTSSFILFSKDNIANMSSMLGYYANAQFKNASKDHAELFQVSADVSISSK